MIGVGAAGVALAVAKDELGSEAPKNAAADDEEGEEEPDAVRDDDDDDEDEEGN